MAQLAPEPMTRLGEGGEIGIVADPHLEVAAAELIAQCLRYVEFATAAAVGGVEERKIAGRPRASGGEPLQTMFLSPICPLFRVSSRAR